jgi:hypothetical protein
MPRLHIVLERTLARGNRLGGANGVRYMAFEFDVAAARLVGDRKVRVPRNAGLYFDEIDTAVAQHIYRLSTLAGVSMARAAL